MNYYDDYLDIQEVLAEERKRERRRITECEDVENYDVEDLIDAMD